MSDKHERDYLIKENKKEKCMMKNCNNLRYKDKYFCEKHYKERRNKKQYSEEW